MRLYDPMFSFDALDAVFSGPSTLQCILDFEAALACAEAKVGILPEASARIIASQCDAKLFSEDELATQAASAGNLAIPLVKKLTEIVASENKDAARFVHYGATSQDAIDTGCLLQLRHALDLISHDLDRAIHSAASLAAAHKST